MLAVIIICISLFVFFLFLGIASISDQKGRRKGDGDEWLFSGFFENAYDELFKHKKPEEIAPKVGIGVEEYYRDCAIARVKPNLKKSVILAVFGLVLMFACLIIGLFTSYFICLIGFFAYLILAEFEKRRMHRISENRREEIEDDLPRFLDLLEAELVVGLPIENAIYILCRKLPDMLLAREFMDSLNRMKLGADGWQDALTDMADRYNVETLSSFVLNITTAYRRGISITRTIETKNRDIKQSHIVSIRERSGKVTNAILLPTALLQLIPMVVFLLFPTLVTLTGL